MTRLRALLTTGLAVVAIAVPAATTAVASAAPYPPVTSASLGAGTTDPCPGDVVTLTGANYGPDQKIVLTARPKNGGAAIPLTTVTSDANGAFTVQVTTPLSSNGTFDITGQGTTSVASIDLNTCVKPSGGGTTTTGNGGGLASTGVQIAMFSGVALLAIAVGALAVAAGRRRSGSRGRGSLSGTRNSG